MSALRSDLALIRKWIKPGAKVLDLGCGDGTLLKTLYEEQHVDGYGLEIDPDNITQCLHKGVNVIQADLDAGLGDFHDQAFDYVIMTQTLQAVKYPDKLLEEVLRIGKEGVVTFPNFGNWRIRMQLAFGGRMPISKSLPATWYNTRNIHLCTFKDFEALCVERNIRILERSVVDYAYQTVARHNLLPNLLGEIATYRCTRQPR